jgi:hypothetical protein
MSTAARNRPLMLAAGDYSDKKEAAPIKRLNHQKNRKGAAKANVSRTSKKLPIESVVCNKILLR